MKMLAENAALYRQHPANVKRPAKAGQLWLALACLAVWSCCVGCPPAKPSATATKPPAPTAPPVDVPLRVWFVADSADKEVIQRQWQATYDRPVEVTMFKADELLQQPKPACDTLVYPAWMLGELVARNWVVELPVKLQELTQAAERGESQTLSLPPGWIDQSRYNRKSWGISLSVLPTVVMANRDIPKAREVGPNESAPADESVAYWQSVIAAMKAARAATEPPTSPAEPSTAAGDAPNLVDSLAVCDRYLTILFSISDNENTIGTLFQPEQLQPRVKNSNFVKSAQIMQELHTSCADPRAMLGSHESAWQAIASGAPNVTISLPPRPSAEVDRLNSVTVSRPPANPARSGMRVSASWNSGRGLMVSISKQCRQTSVSIDFASWIASDASRQSLANNVNGIQSESAYAPGSSAWQAQRVMQLLGQQSRLPAEPRLPHSLAYRQVLGEQIASVLLGQKSIEAALQDVDKAWQEITAKSDPKVQAADYVQSLGL